MSNAALPTSTWALKYGHNMVPGSTEIHSGLTPTQAALLSGQLLSQGSNVNISMTDLHGEQWQRRKLLDFTTRELIDLEVVTLRPLKPGNLSNQIQPFMQKAQWDDGTRCFRFPLDNNSNFDAHNPLVWAVLEPTCGKGLGSVCKFFPM
jgi:hypothetical protein